MLDVDATITIDHSERKENAAATWKRTFGFHPLLVFLDRPEIAGGEALAGMLRPGNAGSNTTADHIEVLDEALAALPETYRPRPGDPDSPRVLIRSDSAGATHGFAARVPGRRGRVLLRVPGHRAGPGRRRRAGRRRRTGQIGRIDVWYPAIDADGEDPGRRLGGRGHRPGRPVGWPAGTRLILRKERPHPGAQLTFTDVDGHRITAFITDTPTGVVPGQLAGLDLRHRQHARVEDRIRQAKATGLRNLPCHSYAPTAPGWRSC